ncbi:MAG: hypothetical protein ACWGOX_01150 [Desulforhopalus sp.]
MRKVAVGSAALACCSALPSKWTTPLLEFSSLPAHATTSGAAKPTKTNPYNKTEKINKTGQISIDKILRSKFVSKKLGTDYGKSIKIEFDTGGVINVPDTSKDVNVDKRGYRPGGPICSHHDAKEIPTMEVYAEPGSKASYITIHYKG